MPAAQRQEETPLLFLFFDDTASSPRRSNLFGNNARYNRISESVNGAQWPGGHGTTCCFVVFIFLVFLATFLVAVITHVLHLGPFFLTCPDYNENDTRVFIVHHGKWETVQLQAIEDIIANYHGLSIQVTELKNFTKRRSITNRVKRELHTTESNKAVKLPVPWKDKPSRSEINKSDINIGDEELSKKIPHNAAPELVDPVKLMQPRLDGLKNLLEQYPSIVYKEEIMSSYFLRTPLYGVWTTFDWEMAELAVRLMALWEFGGISIKLPDTAASYEKETHEYDFKNDMLIWGNLSTFLHMPEGVVNIDDDGLHMETKTPCHAFFGEMVRNIRNDRFATVGSVLNYTMKNFCANGDVTDAYCTNFFKPINAE